MDAAGAADNRNPARRALAESLPVLDVARVIQGVAGGIFPLSFAIVRDEFPADRVPGSIGLMSAILGVGGGLGSGARCIAEHLSWHWLFWIPLAVMVPAAVGAWRYVPESPIRSPGGEIEKRDEIDVAGIVELARAVLAEREHDEPRARLDRLAIRGRGSNAPRARFRRNRKRSAAETAASAKRVSASVVATRSQTPPTSASAISSADSRLARRSARINSASSSSRRASSASTSAAKRLLGRRAEEARERGRGPRAISRQR